MKWMIDWTLKLREQEKKKKKKNKRISGLLFTLNKHTKKYSYKLALCSSPILLVFQTTQKKKKMKRKTSSIIFSFFKWLYTHHSYMFKYKNAPGRSRTCDPGVISTMLYRLSYESLHYTTEERESIDKWINKQRRKKEENK